MEFIGITERGDAALYEGWVDWVYKKNLPAILITKNAPLLERKHPDIFSKNVIIHATCTGLGGSFIEPNVPTYDEILKWIDKHDKERERIVLRVDPICPPLFLASNVVQYDGKHYFETLFKIFQFAELNNIRTRISFLDLYPHVISRLDSRPDVRDWLVKKYENNVHLPLEDRNSYLEFLKKQFPKIEFEICGEPGMPCAGCVSYLDLKIFGIEVESLSYGYQRLACNCLANKKELLDNKHPCHHGCLYCYWRD